MMKNYFKQFTTILFLLFILFQSCLNIPKVKVEFNKELIAITAPKCKYYHFKNLVFNNGKIMIEIKCENNSYNPLTESEYLFYCLKNNLQSLVNLKFDSFICKYNYINQDNREVFLRLDKQILLESLAIRDSVKNPIFGEIIHSLINDTGYVHNLMWLSYSYGKATIGPEYHFASNANVFDLYYFINNEVINKTGNSQLKIIDKMEGNTKRIDNEDFISKHYRHLRSFYNNYPSTTTKQ